MKNNLKMDAYFNGHRTNARIKSTEDLSLKIVFSSDHPGLLGRTIMCSVLDISASGLRVSVNQPVNINSVLDVWAILQEENRKFFLTGNVRWCLESGKPGTYQIGLILRERSDTVTDLRSWQALFK